MLSGRGDVRDGTHGTTAYDITHLVPALYNKMPTGWNGTTEWNGMAGNTNEHRSPGIHMQKVELPSSHRSHILTSCLALSFSLSFGIGLTKVCCIVMPVPLFDPSSAAPPRQSVIVGLSNEASLITRTHSARADSARTTIGWNGKRAGERERERGEGDRASSRNGQTQKEGEELGGLDLAAPAAF